MVAVLFGGLLLSPASRAEAKPIIYPVKLTPIKVRSAQLPPDSKWWRFPGVTAETPIIVSSGRVTSPKPACRRSQPIRAIKVSPYESSEDTNIGVVTDATGRYEGEPVPDFGFTESIRSGEMRFWTKVVRRQLGPGRFCAEAKSPRLKL